MHHALLFIGTYEDVIVLLDAEVRAQGADSDHLVVDKLTIDDARRLREASVQRPLQEQFRSFVVAFKSATMEAQNALLKMLEEPPATSRFFIIVPREDVLIATVRSRLQRSNNGQQTHADTAVAENFATASFSERLAEIADRTKEKDDAWIETLLGGLEQIAEKTEDASTLEALIMVRTYIGRQGASKKMLLEELALTLPSDRE